MAGRSASDYEALLKELDEARQGQTRAEERLQQRKDKGDRRKNNGDRRKNDGDRRKSIPGKRTLTST
jgi:hypothetical protein